MKKYLFLFCTLVLIGSLIGNAQSLNQNLDFGEFDKLVFSTSADVILTQSSKQSIEVENGEYLDFEMKNKTLYVGSKKNYNWKRSKNQKQTVIRISMESLRSLVLSGSGSIEMTNSFHSKEFNVIVSGSGDIVLDGKTEDLEIMISGSGEIDARNMASKSCKVAVSGSGEAKVDCKHSLDVMVSGSGEVYYSGEPEHKSVSITGSGEVNKM